MSEHNHTRIGIFGRGIAMGAADIVPGVSGGTIAFITGIYQRLLEAIAAFNLGALRAFKKGGIKAAWKHVDGEFLAALLTGVLVAIFTLSRLLTYLLSEYPLVVWSFFFGLVLASIVHMAKRLPDYKASTLGLLIFGAAVAYAISIARPMDAPSSMWFIFFAASISICATILPGISGSFVLLLLGVYPIVIEAAGYGDFEVLAYFVGGALFGLLTFVKVVSMAFHRFEGQTIAILTGFLIGSLNTLWPWKITTESMMNRHGELVPVVQERVLPWVYSEQVSDSMWVACTVALIAGVTLVLLMEKMGNTDEV